MQGKYIVIEGAEGVGKTTMVNMVGEMLLKAGLSVKIMREPDSQNDITARALRRLLLDPRYPTKTETEVLLFNAARVQSLDVIRKATANGVICLVDRSYLTTLANQYYGRGDIKDYNKINEIIDFAVGDMQPDLMVVLDAPVNIIRERVAKRTINHGKFGSQDDEFYERVRAGYLWEAKQRNLPVIYATKPIDEVFNEVWGYVTKVLAMRGKNAPTEPQSVAEVLAANPPSKAVATTEPQTVTLLQATEKVVPVGPLIATTQTGNTEMTKAGHDIIEPMVTSTTESVYAFTNEIAPLTVAAAMARLSRRGDDMRVTLLDEFIGKEDKDGQLLKRVITAYGDDSVQQLVGQHIVVENASNLLTKKLEWGRLAAYLEQSTRYIYFDQKDKNGHYRYYVPEDLSKTVRKQYVTAMNAIFDIYSKLVANLTEYVRTNSTTPKNERDVAWKNATKAQACDAIRSLLPVATKSTVGIYASGQALESLIMHLLSDELPEARTVGQQILVHARKVIPSFLERADKPERGGAMVAYRANTYSTVKQLAEKLLSASHASGDNEPVSLVSYLPRNEIDIAADMLYEHSELSQADIKKAVDNLSYKKKLDIFNAYIGERLNRRHRPGRALENIHYTFDLMCDYGIFRDLQRHRMVDDMRWQLLTPRYGFEIPQLVEDAGLIEQYERCFDLSLELYSNLQAAGYQLEAQYATLLGHKMRWRVTMNAREAIHFVELRTSPQGHPGYRKLVYQMYEKIAEVHPLIATSMKFVNKDEDPELTRLAAERYTQYKLNQLDTTS
jgi:dTMP kinase